MKRIILLTIGYFLMIQAGLGALAAFSNPENLVLIWLISGIIASAGYKLIQKGRSLQPKENA